jgi:hypothetical protein
MQCDIFNVYGSLLENTQVVCLILFLRDLFQGYGEAIILVTLNTHSLYSNIYIYAGP